MKKQKKNLKKGNKAYLGLALAIFASMTNEKKERKWWWHLEYERQEYKHSLKLVMVKIKLVFSTNDEAHKEDHCNAEFEKTTQWR